MGEFLNLIGNLIWLFLGGLETAIGWIVTGLILCLTIIGIPFGTQCFKIAGFVVWPFGREARKKKGGAGRLIGNIIWAILFGWILAIAHFVLAIIFAITIIGIPFAKQHFKLIEISFTPFGYEIVG